MTTALNEVSLDQIFRTARTPNGWTDRPVEEDTVREIYELMKWGGCFRERLPGAICLGA